MPNECKEEIKIWKLVIKCHNLLKTFVELAKRTVIQFSTKIVICYRHWAHSKCYSWKMNSWILS